MVHSILLTGSERRRRWSDDERRKILAEAFAPGAVTSAVARRYEVSSGLVYTWRKKGKRQESGPRFLRAVVNADGPPSEQAELLREPAIVVDLANGVRVSIGASASEVLIAAALKALRS
jgi:transposase